MKTRIRLWIPSIMIILSSVFLVTNCTKDEVVTIPVLTTNEVTEVTQTSVISGGVISSDGGAPITERGVCWSTNDTPTIDDNKTTDSTEVDNFTSNITELTANTTYYIRAYATNNKGTGYGSVISFTTLEGSVTITYGSLMDNSGNTYKTVIIGNQTWMAENLKATKYNDGTSIPNITDNKEWYELTTGALCDYENATSNSDTYGKLYNWYAVNTGKLCPKGWHIPSDDNWTELIDYLGGEIDAGGKLKETGTTHWNSPNTDATNETGFTALPCGYRSSNGAFYDIGYTVYWWSATEGSTYGAWSRVIDYNYSDVFRYFNNKELGISVRCVRD